MFKQFLSRLHIQGCIWVCDFLGLRRHCNCQVAFFLWFVSFWEDISNTSRRLWIDRKWRLFWGGGFLFPSLPMWLMCLHLAVFTRPHWINTLPKGSLHLGTGMSLENQLLNWKCNLTQFTFLIHLFARFSLQGCTNSNSMNSFASSKWQEKVSTEAFELAPKYGKGQCPQGCW